MLEDTKPSEPKSLLELKIKKAAPAPTVADAEEQASEAAAAAFAPNNVVDEGDDEASVPGDFEYESDANPEDD